MYECKEQKIKKKKIYLFKLLVLHPRSLFSGVNISRCSQVLARPRSQSKQSYIYYPIYDILQQLQFNFAPWLQQVILNKSNIIRWLFKFAIAVVKRMGTWFMKPIFGCICCASKTIKIVVRFKPKKIVRLNFSQSLDPRNIPDDPNKIVWWSKTHSGQKSYTISNDQLVLFCTAFCQACFLGIPKKNVWQVACTFYGIVRNFFGGSSAGFLLLS